MPKVEGSPQIGFPEFEDEEWTKKQSKFLNPLQFELFTSLKSDLDYPLVVKFRRDIHFCLTHCGP